MNESGQCCNETSPCTNGPTTDRVYTRHDSVGDLSETQQAQCNSVRCMCVDFETLLKSLPSFGSRSFSDRCISEALTMLDYVRMNAIRSISFQGKTVA